MGIKTSSFKTFEKPFTTLKNLPTTWGLRLFNIWLDNVEHTLKNLPTTWGLRLPCLYGFLYERQPLKNLPTTWGLRLKRLDQVIVMRLL